MRRGSGAALGGILLLLLCLTATSGCSDPLGPERDALARARAQWVRLGPEAYVYRYHLTCFCGPDVTEPMFVVVRGATVDEATYEASGQPVPEAVLASLWTVEGLFGRVQDAIQREAVSLQVEYDADLGYPTSVSVDISRQIVDEEYAFTATGLVALD